MGPIDYSTQVADPFQSAIQGVQTGIGLSQLVDARKQAEAQRQQQAQLNADLAAASQDHTLMPGVMIRHPELAEKLKHGWDAQNEDQQRTALDQATQLYAALQSGHADVASQMLRDRSEALRNSGDDQGAKVAATMADWADQHPESLTTLAAARLGAIKGGDKVLEAVAKQRLMPSDERKAGADADKAVSDAETARVTAKYADSNVMQDLAKKGWDIRKIAADIDIARENNRIQAMNAATNREGNDLKRQELGIKVQEARVALDEKIRAKTADAEAGTASIDNMLNTIERVKKNPALNDVVGSFEGADLYPTQVAAAANTFNPFTSSGDDRADAIALIDTLKSQAFLAQIPNIKGMGALSNAEGEKLQAALTNLSRKQSEGQFRMNLDEAARLLNKGRENVSKRFGVPTGKPDTPAAPGSRPPLSSFGGP